MLYSGRLSRSGRPRNTNPYHATHETNSGVRAANLPFRLEFEDTEGGEEDRDERDEDVTGEGGGDGDRDIDGGIVDITEEMENDAGAMEEGHEEAPMEIDSTFDPTGLKEIGNLASWTVSTCKPGCGVEALRDEDTNLFWQSDGPQPHHLNIHFSRMVSILSIRLYLDFTSDESYTPTRITLLAGTGYHDLIPFSSLEFQQPKGWIDVPLEGVGGGPDGNTLRAFLVQVKVVENHQNGKDTHLRGLKIYARDEKAAKMIGGLEEWSGDDGKEKLKAKEKAKAKGEPAGMLMEPEWMGEPELR